MAERGEDGNWPRLRLADWTDTRETLHMWMQIVGKIRMAHEPLLNHWWQVTLYVSPRGLTTSSVPYGNGAFDIEFDFVDHVLRIRRSNGETRDLNLAPRPVADFYTELMSTMDDLGIRTQISATPNEVDPAIPFAEDNEKSSYDPEAAHLFWRQLIQADRVLGAFRAHFTGKVSPVHFFWGAMDLACTRFSGRPAPAHPGGAPNCPDWVMLEGYSGELSSAGFWPGGGEEGAFYSYAYPEPKGFADHKVPQGAHYDQTLGEYVLPYETVAASANPDATAADFLQATYEAAAENANWDRQTLEESPTRLNHHKQD
ncbi:DUF5996 family protein [Actinomadura geliboluensis]|uniref:DUF5996 family protein n=1 Tax=Actinomadura geliboluensis TaxID=882440 RepID=UPI00369B5122